MTTARKTGAGQDTCRLDSDGFLESPQEWSESIAETLAEGDGLMLADSHWQVIRFLRDHYSRRKTVPSMRDLRLATGLSVAQLFRLFPAGGPLMQAVKIAGLPKPSGCK